MKKILLLSILLLNTSIKNNIYCDIKGNVNNPGVYEIKDNYTIKDIIKDAGGLKDNSYTDKINLSKKVVDEMVIYIPTKYEIDKLNELNNCDCSKYVEKCINDNKEYNIDKMKDNSIKNNDSVVNNEITINNRSSTTKKITTTSKIISTKATTTKTTVKEINYPININNCSLEELLTIKGLGNIKAEKIIEYRSVNGLFKSIEEIQNVSGIGDVLFNKIKEFITV